ncbi:hypothetical protein [Sporomusa acidovorans]|uniref:Uncharacterized protein n=1 Tax=Sporomusa acidovorans (strain ATCC 49682 / DSM 3132 / Mol) TaxID=1123286 RepID=A0ABZ3J5Y9_SPOA4|nr:hypothetical protein [Sporomusa acidovorans]OZC23942.1 hypothetical protein SPACI_03600 [Sporomusa acidovorans DSM 3132]SDF31733.1 hypothetical protein SAMN04488499_104330 [Sporomusa acidovorans]
MKTKQRLSWKADNHSAPPALSLAPLSASPAVRELEKLLRREAAPLRPALPPPGAASVRPVKPGEGPDLPAIVRFARRHSERLRVDNRPLPAGQLVKAFNKIAGAFRRDDLFRGHVGFPDLYQRALLQLSRCDLQVNLGAAARGGMADRSLAAFWRSYFRVKPAVGAIDYLATVETAAVLALFSADADLFTDDGPAWPAGDRAGLFAKAWEFFAVKGYLAFAGQAGETFTLSPYALTRVLRQFCWFIDNFHQVNQQGYAYTPPLSCEVVSQVDNPADVTG